MYLDSADWFKKSFTKLKIVKMKIFSESMTVNDKLMDKKAPYNIEVLDNIAKENNIIGR